MCFKQSVNINYLYEKVTCDLISHLILQPEEHLVGEQDQMKRGYQMIAIFQLAGSDRFWLWILRRAKRFQKSLLRKLTELGNK